MANTFLFTDGGAGHLCDLGSAPAVGEVDILCINSDTVVDSVTSSGLRSIRFPSFTERTSTRSAHSVTISPSCGRITVRVSGRMEGRSDETQVKPSPSPTTIPEPFLNAYRLSSWARPITKA